MRNRRLGKRDTSLLIKDIWQEKAAHDAEVRSAAGTTFRESGYFYCFGRYLGWVTNER